MNFRTKFAAPHTGCKFCCLSRRRCNPK